MQSHHVSCLSAGLLVATLAQQHGAALTESAVGYAPPPAPTRSAVHPNDNSQAAGSFAGGRASVVLVAAEGDWRPEGPQSPVLRIAALGERVDALVTPAPLIRVAEGTVIEITVTNTLASPLRLHGLVTHPAKTDVETAVDPGATRIISFDAGAAGTYHYWATTDGKPLARRSAYDSQLGGAFIVDPVAAHSQERSPGDQADVPDRIFVLAEWDERANPRDDAPRPDDHRVFTINGQSWPYTERLHAQVGRPEHWRTINLTLADHPMHLHGFYFGVEATGNGLSERAVTGEQVPQVFTQHMPVAGTMQMTWTPEREGNWLFHCHLVAHIAPALRFWEEHAGHHDTGPHAVHDPATAMAGLVMGVEVSGRGHRSGDRADGRVTPSIPASAARRIGLAMVSRPGFWGPEDAYAFTLASDTVAATVGARPAAASVPGPLLVLKRHEPVEITLNNQLPETTAIHWHGIELESVYDGVPGFSGTPGSTTPAMPPSSSLTVRFTPTRAGTFMYHTHAHDDRQLASGLYGAIVVLDDGETFDPATDHVVLLGMQGPKDTQRYVRFPVVVNGTSEAAIPLKAGRPNRLRFINITTNFSQLNVSVVAGNRPVRWTPLAKDARDLPAPARAQAEAWSQQVSVGETYDFVIEPTAGAPLWLDVRRASGEWVQQVRMPVLP